MRSLRAATNATASDWMGWSANTVAPAKADHGGAAFLSKESRLIVAARCQAKECRWCPAAESPHSARSKVRLINISGRK
ncbi:MAG: hypothetical protein IPN01_05720 [Deltaproteobacteria bacterium]|nr:hypothetical protein [Deltaproteobacteria bacterium]